MLKVAPSLPPSPPPTAAEYDHEPEARGSEANRTRRGRYKSMKHLQTVGASYSELSICDRHR